MSVEAGIETEATDGAPELLWEGQAALFATPDGGRVIRYQENGEDKFVALPAELVPGLEMLRANPGALMAIANGPMGGMARRMVSSMIGRAAENGS